MTGRKLYETVTCELARCLPNGPDSRYDWGYDVIKQVTTAIQVEAVSFNEMGVASKAPIAPPAFDFLPRYEREAWSQAARRLTRGRR